MCLFGPGFGNEGLYSPQNCQREVVLSLLPYYKFLGLFKSDSAHYEGDVGDVGFRDVERLVTWVVGHKADAAVPV